jgi:hypothetical protein
MDDPSARPTLCEVNKLRRTITFYVRDGFGDTTEPCQPGEEKQAAERIFSQAIGMFTGETKSVLDIERWVRVRPLLAPELTS